MELNDEGEAFTEYRGQEAEISSSGDEERAKRKETRAPLAADIRRERNRLRKQLRKKSGKNWQTKARRLRNKRKLGLSRHQKHQWKSLSPQMTRAALVTTMCRLLQEPKKHMIDEIVKDIGNAMAIQVMEETKEVLMSGGMKRADGKGYRKPGGVFIMVLRKHITSENYKQLMKDAKKRWSETKRGESERKEESAMDVTEAAQEGGKVFSSNSFDDTAEAELPSKANVLQSAVVSVSDTASSSLKP
mmetsp:Transcript_4087/g.5876  ORF Transcript_4087/g.5876 Transcript_4087/m.5876 type:complete len:246 (-) Transcript_4087:179-916(-)